MTRHVIFAPKARDDLRSIYDFIAEAANAERAFGYVDRIRTYCERLYMFPERGRRRDDIRQGLRIIGFERRVTIAFHVTDDFVIIDRILYGGRDVERNLRGG